MLSEDIQLRVRLNKNKIQYHTPSHINTHKGLIVHSVDSKVLDAVFYACGWYTVSVI